MRYLTIRLNKLLLPLLLALLQAVVGTPLTAGATLSERHLAHEERGRGRSPESAESMASPPAEPAPAEMMALRKRIAHLEAQNASFLVQLQELRRLIESSGGPLREQPTGADPSTRRSPLGSRPEGTPPAAPDPVRGVETEGGSVLSFYGLARVDAILDSSRPDAIQTPTFINPGTPDNDGNADFTLHPRLTRIGMNYRGPTLGGLGGAHMSGKIETDFQNGGRESRAVPRFRHAYLKLDWESSSILVGQTWDIISPLFPTVNSDTLQWNAGNLGDRRPQFRYAYEPDNGLSIRAGLGLTGAVSPQDLDGNGIRDGEDGALPNLQGRIGYTSSGGGAALGVWGHYALEKTTVPIAGTTEFDGYSGGLDYFFKFTPVVSLKGELWFGANLNDFRGGIGQGVNTGRGVEIESRGGWIELGLKAPRIYTFSAGFTTDDPKNRDILPGGRTENRSWYTTHRFRLAKPFLIGIDYLHWRTNFLGLPQGTNNRFNLYFIYNF